MNGLKFTAHGTNTGHICGPDCSCHGGISASDRDLIKDFVASQRQPLRPVFNEADAAALGMITQHRDLAVHTNSDDTNSVAFGMVTFHAPPNKELAVHSQADDANSVAFGMVTFHAPK